MSSRGSEYGPIWGDRIRVEDCCGWGVWCNRDRGTADLREVRAWEGFILDGLLLRLVPQGLWFLRGERDEIRFGGALTFIFCF